MIFCFSLPFFPFFPLGLLQSSHKISMLYLSLSLKMVFVIALVLFSFHLFLPSSVFIFAVFGPLVVSHGLSLNLRLLSSVFIFTLPSVFIYVFFVNIDPQTAVFSLNLRLLYSSWTSNFGLQSSSTSFLHLGPQTSVFSLHLFLQSSVFGLHLFLRPSSSRFLGSIGRHPRTSVLIIVFWLLSSFSILVFLCLHLRLQLPSSPLVLCRIHLWP
uniref:Uncharacterized protein n=1 Tax=Pararge aegeria TaxID=116150 RepID=S4NW42_9NEOP